MGNQLSNTQINVLGALADVLGAQMGQKHDLPTGFTLSTNYMHGPTGVFGTAGLERNVFSTRVQWDGLLAQLPVIATVDTSPIQAYLTGITAGSGSEPSTGCAECKKAGQIKSCLQGTAFGKICRETENIDLATVGRHVNRGEYYDLRIVNDPMLQTGGLIAPDSIPSQMQDFLNREVLAKWYVLGQEFQNVLAPMIYTGNPANNVGTGYAEYSGLEILVTTGHTDVLTQTSCPSLDSDIKDLNYATVEANAATIFDYMHQVYRYLLHNAEMMGFLPVQWVWVMHPALFRRLTEYWPCVYASTGCRTATLNVANNADAFVMAEMTREMFVGKYLPIDGINIPVVTDSSIPYDTNGTNAHVPVGSFASDIYLLPMTVRGGLQVLFMEHFDYAAPNGVMQAVVDGRVMDGVWSDGGRWLWTYSRTKTCVNWSVTLEPRLRLLTPHLAGRLQNIMYSPLQNLREPFPGMSYFKNGGSVARTNYLYSDGDPR